MDEVLNEKWDNRELGVDEAFIGVAELTPEQQAAIDEVAAQARERYPK